MTKPKEPEPLLPEPPKFFEPHRGLKDILPRRTTISMLDDCPFCGSRPRLWLNGERLIGVCCTACPASVVGHSPTESWNRRAK